MAQALNLVSPLGPIQPFGQLPAATPEQRARVKAWVESTFQLTDATRVMITELKCTEPGCPPIETVIALLNGPGETRQFKIHKPIGMIIQSDVLGLLHPEDPHSHD